MSLHSVKLAVLRWLELSGTSTNNIIEAYEFEDIDSIILPSINGSVSGTIGDINVILTGLQDDVQILLVSLPTQPDNRNADIKHCNNKEQSGILGSNTLTVEIIGGNNTQNNEIDIIIEFNQQNISQYQCVWLNETINKWFTDGCQLKYNFTSFWAM